MSGTFGGNMFEEQLRYIVQGFAQGAAQVTDFNPLSVIRTLCEAAAIAGERIEEEMLARIADGVDQAAYRSFGFGRLLARRAVATLLVSRSNTGSDQTIAGGTLVRVPGTARQYATTQAVTLLAGTAQAALPVVAVEPGARYNTAANTVTEFLVAPGGAALTLTNPTAIQSGADDESDEARRVRFRDYIQAIHRATPNAVAYGARQAALYDDYGNITEQVRFAQVGDGYGVAPCWVWNGVAPAATTTPDGAAVDVVGGGASAALVRRAQQIINGYIDQASGQYIPGYKAAGVIVTVQAATLRVQPISLALSLRPGFTINMVAPTVEAALRTRFATRDVGTTPLRLSELRLLVGSVRGLADHEFLNPTADVAGGDGIAIVPGAIGQVLR